MLIYRVAKDTDGDTGRFLLCRVDDKLMWEWIEYHDEEESDVPRLNRTIDARDYTPGLLVPFLEGDLDDGNIRS